MNETRFVRFARSCDRQLSRRTALGGIAAMGVVALTASGFSPAVRAARAASQPSVSASQQGVLMAQATPTATASLTVALVHGAWADGSSWAGVIPILQEQGVLVVAPANPLRSLSGDAAYIASAVSQIPGPVLLVGHSYAGAVITNAATQSGNVVGLVYVDAFIPDEGETILDLAGQATDSLLGPALRPAQYPTAAGSKPGTEFFIDPASFHAVFCADLPDQQAAVLAATQRPATDLAYGEPSGAPAWKTLPSWAVVGTADTVIGVTGLRQMAARAGAQTIEVDASHVSMLSQPRAVSDLILQAIAAVS
jgi:pimeloyl-ACP methyl ester carboxylesterase